MLTGLLLPRVRRTYVASALDLRKVFSLQVSWRNSTAVRTLAALILVLGGVLIPGDMDQVIVMLAGASAYLLLQARQPRKVRGALSPGSKATAAHSPTRALPPRSPASAAAASSAECRRLRTALRPVPRSRPAPAAVSRTRPPAIEAPVRSRSVAPVLAPTFAAASWDAEVVELLGHILPTPACDRDAKRVALAVAAALRPALPDLEVIGFTCGNLRGFRACCVAVPDVHVVARAPMAALRRCLGRSDDVEERHLRKVVLRVCTERIVGAGFKFRRSAFRGEDPKVTFVAPEAMGISIVAVPLDFSVNSNALAIAALLREVQRLSPEAAKVVLLVRRWAKDRGVCHEARGHLPPAAWMILTVFFLQHPRGSRAAVLPPIDLCRLKASSSASNPDADLLASSPHPRTDDAPSAAELLREFFQFYALEFPWPRARIKVLAEAEMSCSNEAPPQGLDVQNGFTVEDPFSPGANLASRLTPWSYARLKEELQRANALCCGLSTPASLAALLEPWAPDEPQQ
eukprot:TRINITY_DN20772_c0_g5_i1.p1 TRINITY_DN20772_c0_g5~~TRINITY_DN20772_c0_g5_i1.p1  ORF type:complete len:517 (+),score=94.73 TRINITY_DN20772_c0_g5_i1:154-1704(+)